MDDSLATFLALTVGVLAITLVIKAWARLSRWHAQRRGQRRPK